MPAASTVDGGDRWLDVDAPQQYGTYLALRLLIGAAVVVGVAIGLAVFVSDQVERRERDADLAFVAAAALGPADTMGGIVAASGRDALVWRPGEQPEVFLASTSKNPAFDRWRVEVRDTALANAQGRYLRAETDTGRANTTDAAGPADARWRITRSGGGRLPVEIDRFDGLVSLANLKTGLFLNADPNGRVSSSPSAAAGDEWELTRVRTGVFQIRHAENQTLLRATGAAAGYTVNLATESGRDTDWEITRRNDGSFLLLSESRRSIEDRQFDSVDPEGAGWWHTTMRTLDGSTLVASRRSATAMSTASTINRSIAAGAALILAALGWLWLTLHRRVAAPIKHLVDAGEDLRVRGELRPSVRNAISNLEQRPSELQDLGRILSGIEAETIKGHAQAEALLAAAGALGASLEQSTVLARTLDHLHQLLDVERSVIFAYDPRGETAQVIASRGHTTDYLEELLAEVPDLTTPSRRAIRDKGPVQVPDTMSELVSESMQLRSKRHGYRSILAVPLTADLERPTVLNLYSNSPRTFSFDEVDLSQSFASIAGAAIRNAELFARTDADLRTQTSRLDAIVESVDQGIMVESADERLLFANARMRLLAGIADAEAGIDSIDLVSAIADRSIDPKRTLAQLGALDPNSESFVDVELVTGASAEHYRVRTFDVVDSRGRVMGRGQVWTNVTQDRELERMKQGLLATVSHEFRTPLALIKGYATTLLADDVEWEPSEQHEFLTMVSVEADRLTSLVQRLLDMRRIDAGMVTLQLLPTEVGVIIASTLDGMPHQRDRIVVRAVPAVSVSVDAARIVTVLRNLLENACTYSPVDSQVELTVVEAEHELVIRVRDYGPGIPTQMRDRIFETFVRGDSALNAEFGGIGLGLAIARGFVEVHGGTIWVGDPIAGRGTVFSFSLPYDHRDVSATSSYVSGG